MFLGVGSIILQVFAACLFCGGELKKTLSIFLVKRHAFFFFFF